MPPDIFALIRSIIPGLSSLTDDWTRLGLSANGNALSEALPRKDIALVVS